MWHVGRIRFAASLSFIIGTNLASSSSFGTLPWRQMIIFRFFGLRCCSIKKPIFFGIKKKKNALHCRSANLLRATCSIFVAMQPRNVDKTSKMAVDTQCLYCNIQCLRRIFMPVQTFTRKSVSEHTRIVLRLGSGKPFVLVHFKNMGVGWHSFHFCRWPLSLEASLVSSRRNRVSRCTQLYGWKQCDTFVWFGRLS